MTPNPLNRSAGKYAARLLEILTDEGHLTAARVHALEEARALRGVPVEMLLREQGVLPPDILVPAMAKASGLPLAQLSRNPTNRELAQQVPIQAVLRYRILPLRREEGHLLLASDHVHEIDADDELRILLGQPVSWALCSAEAMDRSIQHYYGIGVAAFMGLNAKGGGTADVSALIHEIIREAVRTHATDIHLEPGEDRLRLRFRIDGVLQPIPLPQGAETYQRALVSSIKVMASLNIAEHRKPQDGRFTLGLDDETFDLRVSILPTPEGEAANLRLLNREATFLRLEELGMQPRHLESYKRLMGLSHGMILFTGPTGSGKTTSLYAGLDHLNTPDRKVITLEDPIEYRIPEILQMQVNRAADFTFASGLRSILRHDPDVILIGEIRDRETAEIAVSSALTGHLVFSTLHTNDAAGSAPRLLDLGIESYLVAASLEGVVAQRLVRRVCSACRRPAPSDPDLPEPFAAGATLYEAAGCPQCQFTGYQGRQALFEMLPIDDALRSLIAGRAGSTAIRNHAATQGLQTLRQSGWESAAKGETTLAEVLRVTQQAG